MKLFFIFALSCLSLFAQSNELILCDQQAAANCFTLSIIPNMTAGSFGATWPNGNAAGSLTNNGAGTYTWVSDLPLAGGTLTGPVIFTTLSSASTSGSAISIPSGGVDANTGTFGTLYPYGGNNTGSIGISGDEFATAYIGALTVSSCTGCGAGAYLPLAGGQMTGSITINGTVDIGSASAGVRDGYIYTGFDTYQYFLLSGSWIVGSTIHFGPDASANLGLSNTLGQNIMSWSTSGTVVCGGSGFNCTFSPVTSGQGSMGTSSFYWGTVYANQYDTSTANGVTCTTGLPTASFASVGGIVTHC